MLPDTLLRLPAVKAATGLSRSTIYERVRAGTLPAPIPLGEHAVGWLASEVGAWIQRRVVEARSNSNPDGPTAAAPPGRKERTGLAPIRE